MRCVSLLAASILSVPSPSQELLPMDHTAETWSPLLVLIADGAPNTAASMAACLGFVVAHIPAARETEDAAILRDLRQRFRIEQGGMHLAGFGEGAAVAMRIALRCPHEIQTLTIGGAAVPQDVGPLARLRGRRVCLLDGSHESFDVLKKAGVDVVRVELPVAAAPLTGFFLGLHFERAVTEPGDEVARTLDDFHDAAAKADEARYFAILPDDAVFLGTDATERWTGTQFREFAMPWFQRESAWTYVPLARHVTVAEGGAFAWFDEVLGNEAYGECRGSGVLARRGERWVVLQYVLTIPVPNDLAKDFVARIRAHAEKR